MWKSETSNETQELPRPGRMPRPIDKRICGKQPWIRRLDWGPFARFETDSTECKAGGRMKTAARVGAPSRRAADLRHDFEISLRADPTEVHSVSPGSASCLLHHSNLLLDDAETIVYNSRLAVKHRRIFFCGSRLSNAVAEFRFWCYWIHHVTHQVGARHIRELGRDDDPWRKLSLPYGSAWIS
jgi:hypothetical protein